MVDEIHKSSQLSCPDPSHVHQRLWVWMTFQQSSEEWATSREDQFVSFDTLILTSQGDITEVGVILELSNRNFQNVLKVVSLQEQLLIRHDLWFPGIKSIPEKE